MKSLRTFIFPATCFVFAWVIAHLVSTSGSSGSSERTKRIPASADISRSSGTGSSVIGELAKAFESAPMSDWTRLWEKFANNATVSDLENLPDLAAPGRQRYLGGRGRDVLKLLGQEELAMRTRQAKPVAAVLASIAECDPEGVWDQLRKYNHEWLSCAVLRTLAWRDPQETLKRWQRFPISTVLDDETRTDAPISPSGAIHAAWARRDPAAAVAAMKATGEHPIQPLMTWAFKDGPAALRYLADTLRPRGDAKFADAHIVLRASFQSAPAETARLVNENATLSKLLKEYHRNVLPVWFNADPHGAMEWMSREKVFDDELETYAIRANPAAAVKRIRSLAAGSDKSQTIALLAESDPAAAMALADETGGSPKVEAALAVIRMKSNPEAACDEWLKLLKDHGPDEALVALNWTAKSARDLALFAAASLPDKAKELAAVLPASAVTGGDSKFRNERLGFFWPELALPPRSARTGVQKMLPTTELARNPRGIAEDLLKRPLHGKEVEQALQIWAPHDFAAARAWLNRMPEGEPRLYGELALAKMQAYENPKAVLDQLSTLSEAAVEKHSNEVLPLWTVCLNSLVASGGDWRAWLDRLPDELKASPGKTHIRGRPAHDLAADAQLLALLRKTAPAK
ncbi:MAG TPA: hypothetical protein VG796_07435 [Verrucomicrobiales bacterium]|nr:hypothetical protein [Verrucomicrobiales bacterium]